MTLASVFAAVDALGAAWVWVIAGLVLAGAEILVPGVFLIWLGLAALATGLATAALPIPWQGQTLLFAGLAVALVGLASRLHRRGGPAKPHLNRADRGLIGREGVLEEPIVQGAGRIRFDDTLWRIAGPDLPAGDRVRVTGISGTVLQVDAA
ncbi:NfeD family protein [Methylobacterium mesophilicum SR1.6/6]|uniref:NfeD family protein n=1 Tax=Methylobacterium mesophilicum SR1.6/6 TaxID=908290 RepID=A0A6B9FFF5_9HYPH|nr:NfeD family protein [Methylobacterium mesophilicum]QGY01019.1 NfeD family protein [Methylobacterium mesophilicum SR1.6/6]